VCWGGFKGQSSAVNFTDETELGVTVDVVPAAAPTVRLSGGIGVDVCARFQTTPEVGLSRTPVHVSHLGHGALRGLPDERRVTGLRVHALTGCPQ